MPWKKLLAWATGRIDEALRQKLEFVLAENRVYRALLERHSPHSRLPREALGAAGRARAYPKDEAPAAYKDFDAVLDSVKGAGLANEVARLKARFVIKDADMSLKGAA